MLEHEPLAEDAIANQQPELAIPVGGEQLIEGGGDSESEDDIPGGEGSIP